VPEGDTIWRTAAGLRDALAGMEVKSSNLTRLVGARVDAVEPVGKHLVIRFSNGFALHSHMRMRGAWHVYRPGERWRRPAWRAKAVLETDGATAVCFDAPVVELVRNVADRVGHLGPDILADEWNAGDVVRRARELDGRPVGELLLDQRVTAGIGNIYRCEALWRQKINPWTKTHDVPDGGLTALFEAARAMLRSSVAGARARNAVYGRARRPCPRCSTPIQSRLMGDNPRRVYWCPACQPGP
jgi:endonuclease VIII